MFAKDYIFYGPYVILFCRPCNTRVIIYLRTILKMCNP